jgi:multicomponent Na+:H+ antiporter subunit C
MSTGGYFTYIVTYLLMTAGLFIVIARGNLIKKLIGLGIFQTSVYLLYIGPAKLLAGTAPILASGYSVYSNPLPHVLILTAIVVGVATLALGLALVPTAVLKKMKFWQKIRQTPAPQDTHEPQ